ncbi:S8 family serine peptidase [Sorangium sp. So ce394]|uniref:S8 family serine peptidase n=1 Tax=Sorangium sp. So ce394 TaxID=3133310 RepID=UPI003F5BF9E2
MRKWHRSRRIAVLLPELLSVALLVSSCSELDPQEELESREALGTPDAANTKSGGGESQQSGQERTYRHPLRQAGITGGKVQFVDTKDAPDGSRYALIEGARAHEEAKVVTTSGVERLGRRTMTRADRDALEALKRKQNGARSPDRAPAPKLGPALAAAVDAAPHRGVYGTVLIRLEKSTRGALIDQLERAVAYGEIETTADYRAKRAELLARRRYEIAAAQAPVIDALRALGGKVAYRCEHLECLTVRMPLAAARSLAQRPEIARMDLDAEEAPDADINGTLVLSGTQLNQFVNAGWDGERTEDSSDDVRVAILEQAGPDDEHPGYREDASSTSTRIGGRYECTASGCTAVSDFTNEGDHATLVSGIVMGDLRDGQASGLTASQQIAYSGYAGEALAYMYGNGASNSGTRMAFDHMIGLEHPPSVVNYSGGSATDDPSCLGESALSRDANDLYENGILLVKTAGNTEHSNTSDCTVGSPGSAIGVFTVGGHGNSSSGTETDVRSAAVFSYTSRGGASLSEGKNRSIVDVTAYACRKNLFDLSLGYSVSACGTSISAPTVTAGAINFIDYYKDSHSSLIAEPGMLYTHLLLMGDRQGESGKITHGYDHLWGAGRLKMRRLDAAGMDSPYGWQAGRVCIDDGEVYTLPINSGNVLSDRVDDLKAVVYWYDRRHETGGAIDDIDLRLLTTAGTPVQESLDDYDNKERVYASGVGGKALKLEIIGTRVTSDDEGCGANSMRVYLGYIYEDRNRDDADGPGAEIDPE